MYAAMGIEAGAIGLGTAAFNVLLLRITQKRFSATQYALFSSIFALNRTVAGPPAGVLIDALGWRDFFLLTIPMAIPGMVMLQRFVPWRSREIPETAEADQGEGGKVGLPIAVGGLARRGLVVALVSAALFYLSSAVLLALRAMHSGKAPFELGRAVGVMLHPARPSDWLDLVGPPVAGIVIGFAWAAFLAARHGIATRAGRRT
jgi:PAT family beta-lactamase induction signal transducer AmpG